jgi:hypothetical protein
MALETTFRELSAQLQRLHDAILALQVTVGDRPEDDGSALADGLENTLLDVMGDLHEARTWVSSAQRAAGHPLDLDGVRRALSGCQDAYLHIGDRFATELVSAERAKAMTRLGNVRRGEWKAWVNSIKHGVEQCQLPLREMSKALVLCWQELTEHSGAARVSVHTTNVGQRIISRSAKPDTVQYEPIT